MKVIFLDIDGVLNLEDSGRHLEWDRKAVDGLRECLRETGAKIVISSSWREYFNVNGLIILFLSHGICGENIIGVTPQIYPGKADERALEIKAWLKGQGGADQYAWVAVDDWHLNLPPQHFVRSNPKKGPDWKRVAELLGGRASK